MTDRDRQHLHRRYGGGRPRKNLRIPVAFDVEMGGWKGLAVGRAMDLSQEGIRLRCPRAYAVGDRLALSFTIPGAKERCDVVGEVKWVEPAGSMEQFQIGCTFVHTPQSKTAFAKLLWDIESGSYPEALRDPGGNTVRRAKKPPIQ